MTELPPVFPLLSLRSLLLVVLCWCLFHQPALCDPADMDSLGNEQIKEKTELKDMKDEMNEIESTVQQAQQGLGKLQEKVNRPAPKEFHLIAREGQCELTTGTSARMLTYNGQSPGPVIRVREGDCVRVVLHNDMKIPTSLHFQGLILPRALDGLPRKGHGLVNPGESYVYQFVAGQPGTFWYHPQVIHQDEETRGLYGALIVEPVQIPKSYERDFLVVLGQYNLMPCPNGRECRALAPIWSTRPPSAVTYFTVNGKCAPSIPALEVHQGERIRLRVVNASQQVCPLSLTGHRFEVVSINGGDALEPHVTRDSLAVEPGDRIDLEFVADNPGVWSLSSALFSQASNNGKFPGGIACVVRYAEERSGGGR